jgi:ABC-type lipoprotein release transport system permease subunit
MSAWLTVVSFSLTALMCIASALVAARRVIAADPAEVF